MLTSNPLSFNNSILDDVDKITNRVGSNVHYDTEQIRKDSKNIFNRLKSIFEDAKFVSEISELLSYLSVIANERCGTWYVDPMKFGTQTVYFKSTDGHTGKWAFNLRRLNAHLFDIIIKNGGCIIVDSTRHGKRIPDSHSKTIPIWCCTINNAIKKFRDSITLDAKLSKPSEPIKNDLAWNDEKIEWDTEFHSLPSLISKSEHDQIASLIPQFAQKLLNSGFDMQSLSNKLKKPLRPLWFTPSSNIFLHNLPDYTKMSFYPVICLSASQMVESGVERRKGFLYVQGSADDHEMWAKGLTPSLFWKYHKEILNTNNFAECDKVVSRIIRQEKLIKSELNNFQLSNDSFNFIGNTNIAIGDYKSAFPPECWKNFDYIINCTSESYTSNEITPSFNKNYLQLSIPEGKKGQNTLYLNIPIALEFIRKPLEENKKILIHCKQGIDRSCGIALAIMVKYFDDKGNLIKNGVNHQNIRKEHIQNKLLYITSFRVKANPTKATLKKVNMYFMS
ncbi:tRNA A64-2'-O-ribosylphosphate transferase [Glomus cerebriforme]|uniref:tRNA A64-2'-O-ribosylphosphate transferase n=1 Tax=Glomus cerebriforme TaxID=658196 RepID=A0A397SKW1_9GLOM|nr:tRNA A64-2'-O-ribosylphosphate transferase [Glomus cerebriforme]